MKKIIDYVLTMLQDRGGSPNTKLHFGSLFAITMIVGLFIGVDSALYQIFAFTTMFLFGASVADNISAPKIEIKKTETTSTKKETKTSTDVTSMVNNAVDKIKK